jgi:hypothetical protein
MKVTLWFASSIFKDSFLASYFPHSCLFLILLSMYFISTNVVAEWLTLLFRIRKVPGSTLGLETGYPD